MIAPHDETGRAVRRRAGRDREGARLKILLLGDVVVEPGRTAVVRRLPQPLERRRNDSLITQEENIAKGAETTSRIADRLLNTSADVLATGGHFGRQRDGAWVTSSRTQTREYGMMDSALAMALGLVSRAANAGRGGGRQDQPQDEEKTRWEIRRDERDARGPRPLLVVGAVLTALRDPR
jgi:hypothetical protein